VHEATDVFRFFVSPYHPDVLRQPLADAGAVASDRLRHGLTWNVFRTLEQIAPAFWMRPLVASLGALTSEYNSAPHVCSVSCWEWLDPCPAAKLRRARRAAVRADVVIDTDDTVVTFLVPNIADVTDLVLSDTADGGLLDLLEATSFKGGVRAAYVGVVLPPGRDSDVWIEHVQRRATAVHRVVQASGRHVRNVRGIGALTWHQLYALLADAASSELLLDSERRIAAATERWMAQRLARLDARPATKVSTGLGHLID
jgi:hypothetical protein